MNGINFYGKAFYLVAAFAAENVALIVAGALGQGPGNGWAALVVGLTGAVASGLGFAMLVTDRGRMQRGFASIRSEADQLTGWIGRISSGARDLSQATTQQAGSLQRTASSVEEMSAMVSKSAENAKRSREVATTSLETANQGKIAVERMIGAIADINSSNERIVVQINDSNQKISDIVQVISEIGNKTKVINDIVFQTKLLSFNASVEAARAGEHGKGFAVVAEEVGNLAQMSGNAAKEISDLLSGSIQRVESIVTETKSLVANLVETGKAKVEAGTVVAKQCGEVLAAVVRDVGEASSMIGEIAVAAQEQALGIKEITQAVNQLDEMTQKNRGTSQEAAEVATGLQSRAESLQKSLRELEGGVGSFTQHAASSRPILAPATAPRVNTPRPSAAPLRAATPMPAPTPAPTAKVAGKLAAVGSKVVSLSTASRRKTAASKSAPAPEPKPAPKSAAKEGATKPTVATEQVPSENDPRFKEV